MESWPLSLCTAVGICFSSRHPIWLGWGDDLIMIYNDGVRPMLGREKHPRAMGARSREVWPEIWDTIGPMLEGVLATGEATWSDDQLLLTHRSGYDEECYFTFSYSPIHDDDGSVGGIFCAVTETTERVVGERRMRTLRELAKATGDARSVERVVTKATAAVAANRADLPFALIYLLSHDAGEARLATATGIEAGCPGAPEIVALDSSREGWPLARVAETATAETVDDLFSLFGPVGDFGVEQSPKVGVVLPLQDPVRGRPTGMMVAGVSRQRPLDEDYRWFLGLMADLVETALVEARAYQAERERVETLAELDRAKTEFFSNVSHEFRTPLTLLLAPIEDALADTDRPLAPQQRERVATAARNAERLLKLVDTLLDFSRIEAGQAQATYEPTDLAALTSELAGVFRSAVESAGLELEVDCPPLAEDVYVDREMWEKIVLNLLSNALKFTLAGRIAVRLRQAGEQVELSVADTGTGIPAEELPHLFERFHQVRDAHARTHEGSGIGLALVHDLVRLHDGAVKAESIEGKGSQFIVSIPLGHSHLLAQARGGRTAAPTGVGRTAYVAEAMPSPPLGVPEPPRAATRVPDDPATRVLVVEDNADMRAYLRRLLAAHWTVEVAPDGAAALSAALEDPPDLVLTDVMMPRLDGIGLLQALRDRPETRDVPVVMLSARVGEADSLAALEAGADDYLVKPFTASELVARVRVHLELARSRSEAAAALGAVEEERRAREEVTRFETLAEATTDLVSFADPEGRITYMNRAGRRWLGIGELEDLAATRISELVPDEALGRFTREAFEPAVRDGVWRGETPFLHRDGHVIPTSQVIVVHRDERGDVDLIATIARDITEERQASNRLRELADQDPLTGLLNRRRLIEELDREVSAVHRYGGSGALLVLDLDDFKYVNDSLGHATGDALIVTAAKQLTQRLRESDTLARLGGDEFGVILPHSDENAARQAAGALLDSLREGTRVATDAGVRRLTASVGIALIDEARAPVSGERLLLEADTAMYDAKEAGRDGVSVFDPYGRRQTSMEVRLGLAERVREALAANRLTLHAQRIEGITGNGVPRHELLLRMRDEDGGLIAPGVFLETAERFDLVQAIDRWVVGNAIRLLARARRDDSEIALEVNLSAKSLIDPGFSDWIASELAEYGVPGRGLILEVTETAAVVNFERANRLARRLAELGCEFALDDFGAGFCSFHYLKHLAFDYLKIDGEFVKDLPSSPTDQLIVRAAVEIARGLGKKTVAEFVESGETLDLLRSYGVDYAQGFHIAEPAPVEDVDLSVSG